MQWGLLLRITKAQMTARYRRTFAGFLWVVMSPIVLYGAQALVFKEILHIGIPNYGLFLLGGLLPWVFVVSSLETAIPVPVSSREIFLAMKVKPYLMVLSSVLDNAVNFVSAFLIILVPTLAFTDAPLSGMVLLPLAILPLIAGTAGLAWWLATLNVFFRDVRFVVHFLIGVLFFVTPIFYPRDFVPAHYQWLISVNPVYLLIEPVRIAVYEFNGSAFFWSMLRAIAGTAVYCGLAVVFWKRRKNEFYYHL